MYSVSLLLTQGTLSATRILSATSMATFKTTSSRWAALLSREPLAANAFIYSVKTTKIYCRPTCPSRLARRANIIFHNNPREAEADSFRPCKRCRPNEILTQGDPQRIAVAKARVLIGMEIHGKVRLSVKALASEVGLTESHFCRIFKKVTGATVGEYRTLKVLECSQGSSGVTETSEGNTQSIVSLGSDDGNAHMHFSSSDVWRGWDGFNDPHNDGYLLNSRINNINPNTLHSQGNSLYRYTELPGLTSHDDEIDFQFVDFDQETPVANGF